MALCSGISPANGRRLELRSGGRGRTPERGSGLQTAREEATARRPRRPRDLVALALAVALLVPVGLANFGLATDDAYITYRYAANLLRGEGFVYNPGEKHLGTTSPFLALLLAAAGSVRHDIPFWGSLISIFSLGAAAFFSYLLLSRGASSAAGWLVIPLVILNPVLIESLGNETCLLLAFIVGQYWCFQSGRRRAFAVLGALGALTRGEGIILPLLLFWFDFLRQAREKKWDFQPLAIFAAVLLPWFVFSRIYFGYFLPSTLGVKMAMARLPHSPWVPFFRDVMDRLPGRFGSGGWEFAVLYALFLVGAAAALVNRRFLPLFFFFLAYYLGYGLLRVAAFPWYHAPLAFALSFFAAYGVHFLSTAARRRRAAGPRFGELFKNSLFRAPADFRAETFRTGRDYWLIFIPLGACLAGAAVQRGIAFSDPRLAPYREAGIWIRENTPADATVGIPEVGVVGFYADRRMIDLDGLIFPAMADPAHLHSYQYLIRTYRPDYILSQGRSPEPPGRPGDIHPGVTGLPFRYLLAAEIRRPDLHVSVWEREP